MQSPQFDTTSPQIRILALGDVHLRATNGQVTPPEMHRDLLEMSEDADVVILTGDMTENGRLPEIEAVAALTADIDRPMFAVLGNHDRRSVRRREFRRQLERSGVRLLDGDSAILTLGNGVRLGIAGIGGYGGGFWPDEAPDQIGTRLSQAVALRARREAARLERALHHLQRDPRDLDIVAMHYAPTTSTLGDEPLVKYWMLGNSVLGRVIDRHDIALVLHGHAHLGNYLGRTPGGTPVRNVAMPVVGGPVMVRLGTDGTVTDDPGLLEPERVPVSSAVSAG